MAGHPKPYLAYLGDLVTLLGVFEGAVDFDRTFTGAAWVAAIGVRRHLGPSLSRSRPPHEPSTAIVMYTIPLPCGKYVYSLK